MLKQSAGNYKTPTPDTALMVPRMSITGSVDSSKSKAHSSYFQSRKKTANETELHQIGSTISNGLSQTQQLEMLRQYAQTSSTQKPRQKILNPK